ncbi:MAG: hydroxypyruvate isomerase [Chloroflexi bacterium]|nr:hydroxypyruvate isomerase [Chloroflexota bacterium]
MPKFSANLSMLFTEVGFGDRFERAAKAGFKGVECQFPYELPKEDIAQKLDRYRLQMVLFNIPAGSWAAGERGLACLPGRESEFRAGVGKAIEYAKALKCPRINCLAGLTPKNAPANKVRQTLVSNLKFAADALQKAGITLVVEALNDKDVPGFYLTRTRDALKLFEEVKHPNLFLQYDIYHMQIMEGNLAETIRKNVGRIGHIQLADVPGRHEPGTGEIDFPGLFKRIDEAGYTGWIGCEYKPAGVTEDGLGWVKPYLK